MADNRSLVEQLVSGIEFNDPKLRDAFKLLTDDLYALESQINPPEVISRIITGGGIVVSVNAPTNFRAEIFQNNVRLSWSAPGPEVYLYEIKMGSAYDIADILLTTATLSADIDPVSRLLIVGNSYTFWVATISNTGTHSPPASIAVDLPAMSAPVLTASVLENNVLLSWSIPSSTFFIAYYTVYRDGVQIGNLTGSFNAIFEPVAGTHTYFIQPVDIVTTPGTPSNDVTLTLNNPASFLQFGSILSTWTGTKINTKVYGEDLFVNLDVTETWTTHFTNKSWTTIQNQLDAGYALYFQPVPTTGSYEEVFDFGLIYTNVVIATSYGMAFISGSISVQTQIAVSNDNISFDAFVIGGTRYVNNARYVKVKLIFTGANDKSAALISNLRVTINVKTETEEGTMTAIPTDAGGTHVTLTKSFQLVKAVTLQPLSSTTCFAVYDDLTSTGFDVYVFDAAGVRVSRTVSWAVRGMV
jgi:hypothetical protein